MNPEQRAFFSLVNLPARLTTEQTAWYLNMLPIHIPILVSAGLLKPLGHPSQNGTKHFATCELEALRADRKWLTRATDALITFNRKRNRSWNPDSEVTGEGLEADAV